MVLGNWSHLHTIPHINVLELMAAACRSVISSGRLWGALCSSSRTTPRWMPTPIGRTKLPELSCRSAVEVVSGQQLCSDSVLHFRTGPPYSRLPLTTQVPSLKWSLHLEVFRSSQGGLGSRGRSLCHHCLPRYCSRLWDRDAWALNTFFLHRDPFREYTFHQFPLIPQVLKKIKEDQAWVLLIATCWPLLLSLLGRHPFPLPLRRDLVSQPMLGKCPSLESVFHLVR